MSIRKEASELIEFLDDIRIATTISNQGLSVEAQRRVENLRAALDAKDVGLEELANHVVHQIFGSGDSGYNSRQVILAAIQQAVDGQREADADACLAEMVDAESTGEESDYTYNKGCEHCERAIRGGKA